MTVNITPGDRNSLHIHNLASAGQTEIIEDIFRIWELQPDWRGPYADINCRDERGNTVLHVAAACGDRSLVSLLTKKGAEVNAKTNQGESVLHYAVYNEDPGVIDVLFSAGAEVNSRSNNGSLPVDYAARSGKLEAIKKLLKEGADSGDVECYQRQLLHLSVAANDIELTNMLYPHDLWEELEESQLCDSDRNEDELTFLDLKLGASMQVTDKLGRSAVHIAASLGYADILRIILKSGPGVETLANEKETASGKSPLHFAIESNHDAVVDILLEAGADPLQPDKQGITPIELSTTHGHWSLVQKMVTSSSIKALSWKDKSADFASFLFGAASFPENTPVLVPLLCYEDILRNDCRRTQWLHFHTRRGWTLTDTLAFKRTDGSQHTREELSAFLQAWAFFGLLQALFDIAGVKFNWRQLVYKDESGAMKVTTRHLPRYLRELSLRCYFQPKEVTDLIDKILRLAATMVVPSLSFRYKLPGTESGGKQKAIHNETGETVIPEVALSIFVLGGILMGCRNEMEDKKKERREVYDRKVMRNLGLSNPAENTPDLQERSTPGSTEILGINDVDWWAKPFTQPPFATYDMMLAKGWCKSDATIMHTFGLGPTALYYMSRLDRRRPRADHHNCSEHQCTVHNIDETTYKTKHVDSQCECATIRVDENAIRTVVMSGKIPVIRICTDGPPHDEEVYLKVEQERGRYLTLSHVWADGLGNPKSNSLPKCQLLRLKGLLNAASTKDSGSGEASVPGKGSSSDSVPFWLDTLCIPLERHLRSKALNQLSNAYLNASATLVLDKELMDTSVTAPRTELLARLILSTWMRRLWTLEEALLSARKLLFQFRETCLRYPKDFYYDFPQNVDYIYLRQLHDSMANCLHAGIPSTWDINRKYGLHSLNTLALGLASRTTSNTADEFKCLGSLLDLDVESIAEARDEERPYTFYTLLGDRRCAFRGISPSILFAAGPRLPRPGFRWAPQSFLGRTPRGIFDLKFGKPRTTDHYISHITADYAAGIGMQYKETDDTDRAAGLVPAYCGKRGLHVKLAAWILDLPPTRVLNAPFAFKDIATGLTYMIWQADLECRRSENTWPDCARLAVLHNPTFNPWGVLVAISFPAQFTESSSLRSSAGLMPEQYGLYFGLVRFGKWSPAPVDKENCTETEKKWSDPNLYFTANRSLTEHWCID